MLGPQLAQKLSLGDIPAGCEAVVDSSTTIHLSALDKTGMVCLCGNLSAFEKMIINELMLAYERRK